VVEAVFTTDAGAAGEFVARAAVVDAAGRRSFESVRTVRLPVADPVVPAPESNPVPSLPTPHAPPPFRATVSPGGGIEVAMGTLVVPVESSLSFPGGGENTLSAGGTGSSGGEAGWTVRVEKKPDSTFAVRGQGAFYRLDRTVRPEPTRVVVEDTFTNLTAEVLGIVISNCIDSRRLQRGRAAAQPNGTVFVQAGDLGAGLLAMDDVYHVHCDSTNTNGVAALRDPHFGLDKGASYTLTWAVYPTGSGSYFDFINQVRKDEGLNGRVDGSLALSGSWDPLPQSEVDNKGLAYYAAASLTRVLQNPTMSLEGWEFMEYPAVRQRLKDWIAKNRQRYPRMKIMFHVAHSLYATNKPRELFPDSLAVDENGRADCYGPDSMDYYGSYFSRELVEQGWRWWLFYPTLDNSFGKYMLNATDVMIKELGANAIWADGFIEGYIKSGYTYDRWDGHSVTIDPTTKKVLRKKGNVTYLAMPVLKEVARRFDAAGGVVMTNGRSGPLSFVKMRNIISSNETGGGDQQPITGLYLGRTVTPLGNPTAIQSAEDIWPDILAKLDLGALYFWYGERDFVKAPTIVSHMFPITFDEISEGTVRGRERIVTRKSGVYGWPGDGSLARVFHYDGRGQLRGNRSIACIERDQVRTRLDLGENEAAVLERIPVIARSPRPVCGIVEQADDAGLRLRLNGKGNLSLTIQREAFRFTESTSSVAKLGARAIPIRRDEAGLACTIELDGPAVFTLGPER
jgi:hypothetical protein